MADAITKTGIQPGTGRGGRSYACCRERGIKIPFKDRIRNRRIAIVRSSHAAAGGKAPGYAADSAAAFGIIPALADAQVQAVRLKRSGFNDTDRTGGRQLMDDHLYLIDVADGSPGYYRTGCIKRSELVMVQLEPDDAVGNTVGTEIFTPESNRTVVRRQGWKYLAQARRKRRGIIDDKSVRRQRGGIDRIGADDHSYQIIIVRDRIRNFDHDLVIAPDAGSAFIRKNIIGFDAG